MTLHATRQADDWYDLDFREVIGRGHVAHSTLFGARCIAALHGARLVIDGVAVDKTDMRDVLPTALTIMEVLGTEHRRRVRRAAGGAR